MRRQSETGDDGPTLTAWPAHALAGAMRRREFTAREVLEAHLERIESLNPALNAIVTLDAAGARRAADAADAALARGQPCGALHGVPFTLKDCFESAGLRTTAGHPPLADHVPARDSTAAARLKAAGAVLLGKTNVPPLAMSLQTDNPIFGRTNNPWRLTHTVGGSSGGAAAAVAAGLAAFDIGSDLCGSIRIPAHFCGVYGFKPTPHRLPISGHIPSLPGRPRGERQMAVIGPIARCIDDLALLCGVLAGPDGIDTDVAPVPWREAPARHASRLRIAWLPAFPGAPVATAVRDAVERTAALLAHAGAQVVRRVPGLPIEDLFGAWREYFPQMAAALLEVSGAATPVPGSAETPTLAGWLRALDRRETVVRAIDRLFDEVDAFVCPAVICNAFVHGAPRSPIPVDGQAVESRFVDHHLCVFNMTGHPAVVLPAGIDDDGLPIGVQLVGRRWDDEKLLATARAIDAVLGGYQVPRTTQIQSGSPHVRLSTPSERA